MQTFPEPFVIVMFFSVSIRIDSVIVAAKKVLIFLVIDFSPTKFTIQKIFEREMLISNHTYNFSSNIL